MKKITALVAALTMFVAMTPASAATPALTGAIKGIVIENGGRNLGSGLEVQLVDSRGDVVAGKTSVVASDGSFAFTNLQPGMYTVRVVGARGTSAVSVTAGRVAVATVSVAVAPRQAAAAAGMSTTTKWIIALAVIGGGTAATVAIVASQNDASGSN
jgi:hypothetical protein